TEHQCLTHRLDLVASYAACIGFVHIQFNGLDELLKRRRLQDNVAFLICDQACPVKDDPVITADEVYENYRCLLQLCPMCDHVAAELDLAFVERRSVYRHDEISPHCQHLVRGVVLI